MVNTDLQHDILDLRVHSFEGQAAKLQTFDRSIAWLQYKPKHEYNIKKTYKNTTETKF